MNRLSGVLLALFWMATPLGSMPVAMATEMTSSYDGMLVGNGTIDNLNLEQGYIVVDDFKYVLSNNVTINGKGDSKRSLRKGMRVRFSYAPGKSRPVINEIWISQ